MNQRKTPSPYKFEFTEAPKETIVYTPFIEINSGLLYEQAFDGKDVYYLVYDPKTGSIKRENEVLEAK